MSQELQKTGVPEPQPKQPKSADTQVSLLRFECKISPTSSFVRIWSLADGTFGAGVGSLGHGT